MGELVVFVHGTGVRGETFNTYSKLIEERLGTGADRSVHACFWGEKHGAEFQKGGASVPEYEETDGAELTDEEEELALWSVLYLDPWYKLRLLADSPPVKPREDGRDAGRSGPRKQIMARERVVTQLEDFQTPTKLGELLEQHGLVGPWQVALKDLRRSNEFERAVNTLEKVEADEEVVIREYLKVIAQALVARTMDEAAGNGAAPLAGVDRDKLVVQVEVALQAGTVLGGPSSWLAKQFTGLAARIGTGLVQRKRGALTDNSYPMVGDIIRYQSRGGEIRGCIRTFVADAVENARTAGDANPSVTLIGHSLGGIACVETLIENPLPEMRRLITVGSQAPFFYEIDALSTLRFAEQLPDHFPEWLNIYDLKDPLSYIGEGVFPKQVKDVEVQNGQPFPQSHSAYWKNNQVWDHIEEFLR